ncbi:TPA: WxL domain-containing protein [Enterococcus faecium]|nr:WxL domain-containing protein [Enterococcus faecium]
MKLLKLPTVLTIAAVAGGIGLSSTSVSAATQDKSSQGEVTFTAGALTLEQVPSFDFGNQSISAEDQTYGAQSESVVRVTDLRGTSAGWNLTVTATDLKMDPSTVLTGAQIKLSNGNATNTSNETVTATNGVLTPNSAVKVLDAASGEGNGVSTGTWAQTTGVTLDVPGSTSKSVGKYSADLTWTLTDAPA